MCIALTLCFTGELEVDAFCLTVSGLQRLMAGERVLMVGIIPHSFQKRMFEMITRSGRFLCPGILCMLVKDQIRLDNFYRLFFSSLLLLFDHRESLDAVVRDGEAITQRIKKAVANNDFLAIMSVFQVS